MSIMSYSRVKYILGYAVAFLALCVFLRPSTALALTITPSSPTSENPNVTVNCETDQEYIVTFYNPDGSSAFAQWCGDAVHLPNGSGALAYWSNLQNGTINILHVHDASPCNNGANPYSAVAGQSCVVESSSFTWSGSTTPTPTPTPTPAAQLLTNPSSSTATVGTPFTVNVTVESNTSFNAAQATVTVSNNLDIIGDNPPSSGACSTFLPKTDRTQHTYAFAMGIMGGSSESCTARTLTIMPNVSGSYTIGLSNYSVKSSTDSTDIPTTVDEGSVTVSDGPTPTPTVALSPLVVTSRLKTYQGAEGNEYKLAGTYESPITTVYVDGSQATADSGTWYKSGTTLALGEDNKAGDNSFTIYGSYGSNQTATQVVHVERHLLGDIDGNGVVDLGDASLLAIDYGNTTGTLNNILSNMNYDPENPDNIVDITDLSILARNWTN